MPEGDEGWGLGLVRRDGRSDVEVRGSNQACPKHDVADALSSTQRDNANAPRSSSPRQQSPTSESPPPPSPASASPPREQQQPADPASDIPRHPQVVERISNHASPQRSGATPPFQMEGLEEVTAEGTDYVLVQSPHSKARALRALRKEQLAREQAELPSAQPSNRVKTLPTPPVAPVLPDFDDIVPPRRAFPEYTANEVMGGGVRRKGSVVKKLRDRIVK